MNDNVVPVVPMPRVPGEEIELLKRFYFDCTWSGVIEANGMGPGSPRMTATGSGKHHTIQDGRWIVGDYQQDQRLEDGTFVLKWELHWVAGWDAVTSAYVATMADCYGNAGVMMGKIEGDQLIYESPETAPVRIRLTWDLSDAAAPRWRNELSTDGSGWTLIEEYRLRPL